MSAELRFSAAGDKLLVVRHYVQRNNAPLVTVHDVRREPNQGRLIYFPLSSPDLIDQDPRARRFGVSAAFGPGGNVVATTSFGTARLWDISRGHKGPWPRPVAMELPGSAEAAFTKNGKHLLTASLVGGEELRGKAQLEVRLWDAGTGKQVDGPGTAAVPDRVSPRPTMLALAFAPDESFFLTAAGGGQSDAKSVQLWDAKTLKPRGEPLPAAGSAYYIGPDGKTLLAVARRETALWDLAARKLVCTLPTPEVAKGGPNPQYHLVTRPWVAAHPNGTSVLYRKGDQVTLWDLSGEKPAEKLALKHPGRVYWLAISHDGKRAATACEGSDEVLVWSLETGKPVLRIPETGTVEAMEFSPDGRALATANAGDVHIWNLEPRK
jgi:WD40 repeat protein